MDKEEQQIQYLKIGIMIGGVILAGIWAETIISLLRDILTKL